MSEPTGVMTPGEAAVTAHGNPAVLVTGASGFVGRRVCRELERRGHSVRAVVRQAACHADMPADLVALGDFCAIDSWEAALDGMEVVIHAAARVHNMNDTGHSALAQFRAINVKTTESLARAAAANGVRRFVYVSSIKVNGDATSLDSPFTAADPARPVDPYGVSKWEAEEALRRISAETGLEVVIVRPPLVYGPGVRANFLRLMRLVDAGAILPLRSVRNARSLIYVDNLVSALLACASAANAASQTFLVCDAEDLSTPELVRRLAQAFGKRSRLVPVPIALLRLGGSLTGRQMEVDRLTGSLRVDASHIRNALGWTAPHTVDEALADTVRWFKTTQA